MQKFIHEVLKIRLIRNVLFFMFTLIRIARKKILL